MQEQYGDQIIQLSSNKLPKALVTLESIFTIDDQFKKNKSSLVVHWDHYEDLKILKGRNLKFGKAIPIEEITSYIHLFQEFDDVFSWEYVDLKGFDPHLAEHTIELEPNSKPIR